MDNTELLIIVVAFALVTIIELVLHYLDRSKYAAIFETISNAFFMRLDTELATPGMGATLKPINVAAAFVESLIDEDTDALSALIPADLRKRLREKLDQLETLTDGVPIITPEPEVDLGARIGGAAK